MKLLICIILFCMPAMQILLSQESAESLTENVLRVNAINPSIEYEISLSNKGILSSAIGVGYHGSLQNTTLYNGSGFQYLISPFIDLELKKVYNIEKRLSKGKNIDFNSGNYWGARLLARLNELESNFERTDNVDLLIGPVWGLQRSIGKVHFLFDVGPIYYFDTKGNNGFFPIMIQLNFGLNLKNN